MKQLFSLVIALIIIAVVPQATYAEMSLQQLVDKQKMAKKDGRFDVAINYGKIALKLYRNGKNDTLLCRSFDTAGSACVISHRYIEALEFYTAAVELGKHLGNARSQAIGLNDIGNIYEIFGDYEQAESYYQRALQNAMSHHDEYMTAAALVNLVNVNCLLGDSRSAQSYYDKQRLYRLHTTDETAFWLLMSQAEIAGAQKNHHGAIYYYHQARQSAILHQFSAETVALTQQRIAREYESLGMTDSVIASCRELAKAPHAINLYPNVLVDAYQMLARAYHANGENSAANHYQLLNAQLSDSLFNKRLFNATRDRLVKYEDAQVQSSIFSLKGRMELYRKVAAAVAFALIVALAALIPYHIYNRRLTKANRLLVSKNQELISHTEQSQQLREQLIEAYKHEDKATRNFELPQQQLTVILRDIHRVMQQEDIISNPSFGLVELAQRVNSNTTYVSTAINDTYHKNFKTYLNEHRIQLAATRLLSSNQLTIQAIAESVGFKSASSFISAFKRVMGMTPSEYRRYGGTPSAH